MRGPAGDKHTPPGQGKHSAEHPLGCLLPRDPAGGRECAGSERKRPPAPGYPRDQARQVYIAAPLSLKCMISVPSYRGSESPRPDALKLTLPPTLSQ